MKDKQKVVEDILENYLTLDNEEFMSSMVVQFDEHMIPDVSKEIIEELGDGWISVEDRLPEKSGKYIVTALLDGDEKIVDAFDYRTVRTMYGDEETWYIGNEPIYSHPFSVVVTHWMPLPEEPK